jgi:hypothetical protein
VFTFSSVNLLKEIHRCSIPTLEWEDHIPICTAVRSRVAEVMVQRRWTDPAPIYWHLKGIFQPTTFDVTEGKSINCPIVSHLYPINSVLHRVSHIKPILNHAYRRVNDGQCSPSFNLLRPAWPAALRCGTRRLRRGRGDVDGHAEGSVGCEMGFGGFHSHGGTPKTLGL